MIALFDNIKRCACVPPPLPSPPPLPPLPPATSLPPPPSRSQEFYKFATTRLTPGGLLVTQSGAAAVHLKDECFTVIHKTLKTAFKNVVMSVADVPSFGCCWGFNLASNSDTLNTDVRPVGSGPGVRVSFFLYIRTRTHIRFFFCYFHCFNFSLMLFFFSIFSIFPSLFC